MVRLPELTIIMPNYNHERFLIDSVQAVLTQSYLDFELLVIDDGSTDGSVHILETLRQYAPNLHLIKNSKNLGVARSLEIAIEASKGEYIAFQSADDLIYPGFVEKLLTMVGQYPQAGLCCSIPAFIDEESRPTVYPEQPRWLVHGGYWAPADFARELHGGYINGHTAIVKKAALAEAGGMLPQLRWHCDWFALLVIAFRQGVCCVPEVLAGLRVLNTSYSNKGRNDWSQQSIVVTEIIKLLVSPAYSDVAPLFFKSGALRHMEADFARLLEMPEFKASPLSQLISL